MYKYSEVKSCLGFLFISLAFHYDPTQPPFLVLQAILHVLVPVAFAAVDTAVKADAEALGHTEPLHLLPVAASSPPNSF